MEKYLYLKFYDFKTDKKYLIGALYKKDGKYYFKMSKQHVQEALKAGVYNKAILPFDNLDTIYESKEIFAIFKVRLPRLEEYSKEELDLLLKDLDMEEYDEFEYLRKTKGQIMTDHFIVEEEK